MKNRCVIVSAGPVVKEMKEWVRPEQDFLIACDAGRLRCREMGLLPDLVIGDFDSSARPAGNNVIVLPHEKDDTDTQYAARQAVVRGYREVLMLGALGGRRMEHMLANLATGLWLEKQGVRVTLADENSRISYLRSGETRRIHCDKYDYFSLFPAEGSASGILITGAAYPLADASLEADFPVGVSNEYRQDTVELSVAQGFLLLVESRADC